MDKPAHSSRETAQISLAQLEDVRTGLRPLHFEPSLDDVEKTACEQTYLNYYGLRLEADFPGIRHILGSFSAENFNLACQYWLPAATSGPLKGTVFITHGYFDHMGIYVYLIRYLLRRNYAVVAFDLPGHGLSSGKRVSIDTFDDYVDVFSELLSNCESHLPQPWKAVGQSTGGAILMKYLLAAKPEHYRNPLQAITLLAPLIHPTAWRVNLWVYRAIHKVIKNLKRKFVVNSNDSQFNRFIATSDPLQDHYIPLEWVGAMKRWTEEFAELPGSDFPVKVIQGDQDTTVDWRYNLKAIGEKLPQADVVMIAGARHHLVNESVSLRDQIFENIDV